MLTFPPHCYQFVPVRLPADNQSMGQRSLYTGKQLYLQITKINGTRFDHKLKSLLNLNIADDSQGGLSVSHEGEWGRSQRGKRYTNFPSSKKCLAFYRSRSAGVKFLLCKELFVEKKVCRGMEQQDICLDMEFVTDAQKLYVEKFAQFKGYCQESEMLTEYSNQQKIMNQSSF